MKTIRFFCTVILITSGFFNAYGIWAFLQEPETQGAGNVNYSGFITLPLYLTTEARNDALQVDGDRKYKVYGGSIRYGISKDLDFIVWGNYSVNSSIGIGLKYRFAKHLASSLGLDYILDRMVLAPSGTIVTGIPLSKNFSFYSGFKGFYWQEFYINNGRQENHFDVVLLSGIHIFRHGGFRDLRFLSFLPLGIYLELGYPVNLNEKAFTISLGLDGFLGFSLPRP
ncbi:MAG: hypothetical protein ABIK73_05890 [candidate division WOR-3 bacterium]